METSATKQHDATRMMCGLKADVSTTTSCTSGTSTTIIDGKHVCQRLRPTAVRASHDRLTDILHFVNTGDVPEAAHRDVVDEHQFAATGEKMFLVGLVKATSLRATHDL